MKNWPFYQIIWHLIFNASVYAHRLECSKVIRDIPPGHVFSLSKIKFVCPQKAWTRLLRQPVPEKVVFVWFWCSILLQSLLEKLSYQVLFLQSCVFCLSTVVVLDLWLQYICNFFLGRPTYLKFLLLRNFSLGHLVISLLSVRPTHSHFCQ